MGAVLCNNYDSGARISCGSDDYTIKSENRDVMQWKAIEDDWSGGGTIKKKELAPFFNIVDFASEKEDGGDPPSNLNGGVHCKRVSQTDDVLKDSSNCYFNKEFTVKSTDVKQVIERYWGGDEQAYISNPKKLVVTALACKDRQDDCSNPGTVEHSIVRMDTDRSLKVVQ